MAHSEKPGPGSGAANPDARVLGAPSAAESLRIRRAVPEDAREMARLGIAAWRAAYRELMPRAFLAGLSVEARTIAWRANLEQQEVDRSPVWVAELEGAVAGYASSGPPRDEDLAPQAQTFAEIYALYVDPLHWRSGVGRALFTTAVAEWRIRGARHLVLWVLEGNRAARHFYEAMGMQPDGGRQTLDKGDFSIPEVRYRLPLAHAGASPTGSSPPSTPYP